MILTAVLLAATIPAFGQAASSQDEILDTFLQERLALADEMRALADKGATPAELQTWREKNSVRFDAQLRRARVLTALSATRPVKLIENILIPPGASPTLETFLTTRAELFNAFAQMHNQRLQAEPVADDSGQPDTTLESFYQQNTKKIEAQLQRAKELVKQSASKPLPTLPQTRMSANTPPKRRAFLIERSQLSNEQTALMNQYRTADPAVRDEALRNWRQQNAARFKHLQQLAQDMSKPTQEQR